MKRKRSESVGKAFAMVTQLSLTVLSTTGLFLTLGIWLDDRYGWSTTLPLLILGLLGGGKGAYNLAKRFIEQEGKDES